jgi:hypothetical protein
MTQEGVNEPGDVSDINLGLTETEAGNPSHDPPEDDVELGEAELLEDLGDDLAEEE